MKFTETGPRFSAGSVQVPSLARALEKGGLAQLVERLLCKQNVNGSNPLTSTIPAGL